MSDFSWYWLGFPLLGCLAGFMAGLLGVGGGLISVPIISLILIASGVQHPDIHKIALASSTAAIMFTSFSSMRSHLSHHNVDMAAFKGLVWGVLLGVFVGTFLVHFFPITPLKLIFVAFTFYTAYSMFLGAPPRPSRTLPSTGGLLATGSLIGSISTLISAGGGFITVPFLIACNVPTRVAMGTSAVLGFPIAVFGTAFYLLNFYHQDGLPPHTFAYIYLPAVIGIAMTSVLFAPIGARMAQIWPVRTLKRVFAAVLLMLGLYMIYTLVH